MLNSVDEKACSFFCMAFCTAASEKPEQRADCQGNFFLFAARKACTCPYNM